MMEAQKQFIVLLKNVVVNVIGFMRSVEYERVRSVSCALHSIEETRSSVCALSPEKLNFCGTPYISSPM
jgi:hypothetical protein